MTIFRRTGTTFLLGSRRFLTGPHWLKSQFNNHPIEQRSIKSDQHQQGQGSWTGLPGTTIHLDGLLLLLCCSAAAAVLGSLFMRHGCVTWAGLICDQRQAAVIGRQSVCVRACTCNTALRKWINNAGCLVAAQCVNLDANSRRRRERRSLNLRANWISNIKRSWRRRCWY